MLKRVYLENIVILDNVFSFKSLNAVITNCEFEFDSIVVLLDNDILVFYFYPRLLSSYYNYYKSNYRCS